MASFRPKMRAWFLYNYGNARKQSESTATLTVYCDDDMATLFIFTNDMAGQAWCLARLDRCGMRNGMRNGMEYRYWHGLTLCSEGRSTFRMRLDSTVHDGHPLRKFGSFGEQRE